jgi:transcriptional regulator GlxA family with amidase domain
VASVCTGAFPLARAGLLDGQPATTHWEDLAELRARFPAVRVVDGVRWTDTGRVATSAGVSAGIDLALHLVARETDEHLAVATARQMDYPWSAASRTTVTSGGAPTRTGGPQAPAPRVT